MAGQILVARSGLWAETVRALIVHSAEWTPQMRARIDACNGAKGQIQALVRRYGCGAPDIGRALLSTVNDLTLIVEDQLQPFQREGSAAAKTRDMKLHRLPWPKEQLVTLGVLGRTVSSPLGEHLVFKGGTSLSKAYGAIRRFSEDVDLTYDIRAIAPDLVKTSDSNPVPQTRSQGRKWSDEVRDCLPNWVRDQALPVIRQRLEADKLSAKAEAKEDKIFVTYDPLETGSGCEPRRHA